LGSYLTVQLLQLLAILPFVLQVEFILQNIVIMTLKEKIKHMLHPSGHKKSLSSSSPTSSTSSAPVSQTPHKPNPDKPPNARDPGFRKSFNLSEDRPSTDEPIPEPAAEPKEIAPSAPQDMPVDGNRKMYSLDKYGEDYLAVSPRTNVTVPEGTSTNRGLSTVSPLDGEAKAALGTFQERKPAANTTKDLVSSAAKNLDELSVSQQDPDYGRDQFALGDRKDNGFIEPVPTRDLTVANVSPERQHPTTFNLESTPAQSQVAWGTESPSARTARTTTRESADTTPTNLLSPPLVTGEGSSNTYSDESATRPSLPQAPSSVYSQTFASSSLPLDPSLPTKATAYQQQYASLVADIVPDVEPTGPQPEPYPPNNGFLSAVKSTFPDSAKDGNMTLASLDSTENTHGLLLNATRISASTPEVLQEKNLAAAGISTTAMIADSNLALENGKLVPENASKDAGISVDQQAEAFADIVGAHLESLTKPSDSSAAKDQNIPDVVSSETTSSSNRPLFKHGESVLEVTKGMPGSF